MTRLWGEVDSARIHSEELPVLESTLTRHREPLGETPEPVAYCFRTPWLGLNQDNYRAYQADRDSAIRQAILRRVLVGNCLSLAKAFGHHVRACLTADVSGLRPWTTRLKGVEMLGFLGTFHVNFHIPERVGIGKSVSRGFGTVERMGRSRLC